MTRTRIVGISFDHMHMGDLLRMVARHPGAELVGIFDPDRSRMQGAVEGFGLAEDRVFTDFDVCLDRARPDLAILCAATADHASYTERLAARGVHVLVEKPFAATVADARRMIAAMERAGKLLAVNWPAAWAPEKVTARRLVSQGVIGEILEVHYYGGNRGPLYHLADKVEVSPEEVERQKPHSWWYRRASGGGSLLDYLGYGATLGTWYRDGEAPIEVTSTTWASPGLEVDEQSVTVCRYAQGLSVMQTRWGTFTDPWTIQPQPRCGFVLVGRDGTLSAWDYDPHVTVQTRARREPTSVPVDAPAEGRRDPVEYIVDCLRRDALPEGPLDPAVSLTGQRIVDSAVLSAEARRPVPLLD